MPVVNEKALFETSFSRSSVSFIGSPKSESVLYVGKKFADNLRNLKKVQNCLVFVEEGVQISDELLGIHDFVVVSNPVYSYAKYVIEIAKNEYMRELKRNYKLTEGGYYVGENVLLGEGVIIEPGAFIGHDVSIGAETVVLAHAIVKHAVLGKRCLVKENAQIGGQAFTFAKDEDGNQVRVPCLGDIVVEDEVEIGSFTTVCRGSNTSTTLHEFSKIDDHVHIGHDVIVGRNATITAGVVLGGYDIIGENAYIGLNATLKQLITIEDGAVIGMGARVARDVKADGGFFGSPKPPANLKS